MVGRPEASGGPHSSRTAWSFSTTPLLPEKDFVWML